MNYEIGDDEIDNFTSRLEMIELEEIKDSLRYQYDETDIVGTDILMIDKTTNGLSNNDRVNKLLSFSFEYLRMVEYDLKEIVKKLLYYYIHTYDEISNYPKGSTYKLLEGCDFLINDSYFTKQDKKILKHLVEEYVTDYLLPVVESIQDKISEIEIKKRKVYEVNNIILGDSNSIFLSFLCLTNDEAFPKE